MPSHVVFIAGASGYTGREVVRVCRTRQVTTVAHVRPDSPSLDRWRQRFASLGATVDTTPWEEAALAAALARVSPTHVFALLGTTRARAQRDPHATAPREGAGTTDPYERVDYGLTAMLLRAAAGCGTRPRFVYLSALGAREDSRNAYLRARGRLEREIRRSGLPFLIVRPSFITGPDRDEPRPLERTAAIVLDGALALLGALGADTLRDRYRSLTGARLAEGMVRLALESRTESMVVDAAAVRSAARHAGRKWG
ncbi:MAG: NAD(P)H-binding protein [Gemmatimonadota bacterium]|nr:NAD(P)H-binding protein [Gemmatimonadota bacterium]